jgi:hypothetical protein
MSPLYVKGSAGRFFEIELKEVMSSDWNNKLVLVKVDTEEEAELQETIGAFNDSDALDTLENTSFLFTLHGIHCAAIDKDKAKELIGKLQEYVDKE